MNNKFLFTIILTTLCLLIFIAKSFAQENKAEIFKVNKGGTLMIEISGGDIDVKISDKNEVKIVYDKDDYSSTQIRQNGNDIKIISGGYLDLEITVPSEYNLNLNTSGGDVGINNNIKGKVRVSTSGGDIKVMDVEGEVSASTSGGDIKCGNIKGDTKVSSGGGDIIAGSVEGDCNLSSGGGNIKVGNVSKKLNVATGGGNVESGNTAGDLNIVTGGGNVSAGNVGGVMNITTGGGNVSCLTLKKSGKVVTGSGEVNLKNVSGGVEVTSGAGNAAVEFTSVGNEESKITTGYGNITVHIPANSKATIEAVVKLSEGNVWSVDNKDISEFIKSDFETSNEDKGKGEYRAVYVINGGGTNIYLQSSLGVIEIRKSGR